MLTFSDSGDAVRQGVRLMLRTQPGQGGHTGCTCQRCRQAQTTLQGHMGAGFPVEVRQRLLGAIYAGTPFRTILRDLGLTPNQVWRLTKTDGKWAGALEAALTATRRDDLKHGTTTAYVRGCVCSECREGQRRRMAKTWRDPLAK